MSWIAQRDPQEDCESGDLGRKRKRMPSIYAQGITELKKITSKLSRKSQGLDQPEDDEDMISKQDDYRNRGLDCVLPTSKRQLKIHIIIKKNKAARPKPVRQVAIAAPAKTPPTQPKSQNLLDALFKLCEEHKVNEQLKSKDTDEKNEEGSNSHEINEQKAHRTRRVKEDEDKYARMYEKYLVLTDKMELIDVETFML